jgi:MFS family permease
MFAWLKELDARERKTLIAATGGWATDSIDVTVFAYVVPTLIALWGMSKVEAGWITTATVISSAIGGWLAGVLADRFGRVRILQLTILWFAFFTFLCGFTGSFDELLVTRALQGLGFGGEWAVGSVLIGEMIRPEHRGKAVGTMQSGWAIGWGVANLLFLLLFSFLPEQLAWRALFWSGILPALLVVYIRRNVPEPEVYSATKAKARERGSHFTEIFSPGLLKTTALTSLMVTGMMAGYYATFFWLPTFLKTERGLSVLNTGYYTFVVILGSFLGYIAAAYASDHLGRKNTFFLFAAGSAAIAVVYTMVPIDNTWMLFLGFPLGFFVSGNFSGCGPFLTELYPSRVRGSGQGFAYNFGRGMSAFATPLVGYLSNTITLGRGIGVVAVTGFAVVILTVLLLPETRGKILVAYD